MIDFPLRPSGTSPSKLGGGCDFSRSTNLLGELREAVRGCLPRLCIAKNNSRIGINNA
jgi:hypothetical protein